VIAKAWTWASESHGLGNPYSHADGPPERAQAIVVCLGCDG